LAFLVLLLDQRPFFLDTKIFAMRQIDIIPSGGSCQIDCSGSVALYILTNTALPPPYDLAGETL
jgi:hypothetical protein